ncbi:ras association domain-containing protein 8 [Denticeps clupeoides]|uniref:Ras-associating domain-containing protein n=1 Tax=Denticeps clupeoides TaxID=299321 RepID=A0AAY4D115_9TELE|nr:ras association domain-containing protein 8-like [Denticeps clupeoides]XP_028815152.1 ras association domain-containing protein 8-like [Denticeps clupeoides]XP_028815153.1 ras association domain-containing protein 8-like [Denticeps clupeoides]XP_028815155.1 ras association domain-containing protein 8-like [Denticeps clupeoides]
MELKVWVDGVQRVVCGVSEATTCQEVVIALAQAIGRTGRYTLIEKWRDTERHLAPHERPVASLNTWGQYAGDVQLILHRTGPSLNERPPSEGMSPRIPERGLHRQSLPLMAKLRTSGDHSLRRREPRRKSLTFTGGPRSLRDILSGGRTSEAEVKRRVVLVNSGHNGASLSPQLSLSRTEDLTRLVRLQSETLGILGHKLEAYEVQLRTWRDRGDMGGGRRGDVDATAEEMARLELLLRKNKVEIEEEDFWTSELEIERESERQLDDRLQELRARMQACDAELRERLSGLQVVQAGLEAERLQMEQRATQQISEAEVRSRLQRVVAELKVQNQHAVQLESSCRAVDRSLGQSGKRLQDKQLELEQLTKELRQVNLQQFIQQTGTKVTVLPVEPSEEERSSTPQCTDFAALSGSLKRPTSSHSVPAHMRVLQTSLGSALNPEGIYV